MKTKSNFWMGIAVGAIIVGVAAAGFGAYAYTHRPAPASVSNTTNTTGAIASTGQNLPSNETVKQPTILIPGTTIEAFVVPKSDYAKYKSIAVQTPDGKQKWLDATKEPVFFMAYWCPHCHKVEQAFALDNIKVKPAFVSVWFNGQSLKNAQLLTTELMKNDGVGDYPLYYQPDDSVSYAYVTRGTPTLITMYQGQLIEVVGEIRNENDWNVLFGTQGK